MRGTEFSNWNGSGEGGEVEEREGKRHTRKGERTTKAEYFGAVALCGCKRSATALHES
jgi:hypothetical protein